MEKYYSLQGHVPLFDILLLRIEQVIQFVLEVAQVPHVKSHALLLINNYHNTIINRNSYNIFKGKRKLNSNLFS